MAAYNSDETSISLIQVLSILHEEPFLNTTNLYTLTSSSSIKPLYLQLLHNMEHKHSSSSLMN